MSTQDMNTTDALRAILDNLEAEQALKNQIDAVSYLNQPDKLAISSNDGEQAQVNYNGQFQNAFYNFTINLPRPAVNVKTLELLSANIPQAQVNIPDEALIFFYYRIKTATTNDGTQTIFVEEPSIDNINYIRLLPSYYKQELVQEYPTLGFNRTFANYADLAEELVKACANDLIYEKTTGDYGTFIPNDISITYNQVNNKFEFTGNNTDEAWTIPTWNSAIITNQTSIINNDGTITYNVFNNTSIVAGNTFNVASNTGTGNNGNFTAIEPTDINKITANITTQTTNGTNGTILRTYQLNAIVTRLSVNYISIINNNISTPTPAPTINAWVTSPQVYLPLAKVSYLGINYVCIYENNGIEPIGNVNSTTYWIPLNWSASYDYSNIRAAPYNLGWPVFYNGLYYQNITTGGNLNKRPDLNLGTYWALTYNWQVYTGTRGYTYLSAGYEDPVVFEFAQQVKELSLTWDFDFNGRDPVGYELFSIPPQPIAQGQTLNLRLGFTWDGIYTWSYNTIFTGNLALVFKYGNIQSMLFNRLRPVPLYRLTLLPEAGLTTPIDFGDPYTATTYTADAFCNLVYSSIVSIYTSIIGPSTTDTQRNTNLLSIVPMDCNNLGVTFYQPTLTNKYNNIVKDI
jgi:hypothetical protein